MARDKKKEQPVDTYLLEKIQPQGGITFMDAKYISTGGGYEACLHIFEYPKTLDDYWLANICNIPNTAVFIDIATDDVITVKKNINRSMKEQTYRYNESKNFQESYDAKKRFQELETLYDEISNLGEVVKLIHARIFISDSSWIDLEEKIKNIKAQLESNGYLGAIFMNETKSEWTSMFKSYARQENERFFVYGQPLTSSAIATGNPFHYSHLSDENGLFLGKTPCGGDVLFNLFLKSQSRLYYNFLFCGTMGSCKSTLLKKLFLHTGIVGDFVRTFDISGEFTMLTNVSGGKVLKLDGSNGILNPLEILRGGDDDVVSFTMHISKVSTIYKFLVAGDYTTQEIIEFEELLRQLYKKWGFELKKGKLTRPVTGLPAKEYPIFEDMLSFINDRINEIQAGT